MSKRNRKRLTSNQWDTLADLLEIAAMEVPELIGFKICETSARALSVLRKMEKAHLLEAIAKQVTETKEL